MVPCGHSGGAVGRDVDPDLSSQAAGPAWNETYHAKYMILFGTVPRFRKPLRSRSLRFRQACHAKIVNIYILGRSAEYRHLMTGVVRQRQPWSGVGCRCQAWTRRHRPANLAPDTARLNANRVVHPGCGGGPRLLRARLFRWCAAHPLVRGSSVGARRVCACGMP